jgi:hypothetical protein
MQDPNKTNVESIHSSHKGLKGIFETALRRFKVAMHLVATLPLYALGSICIGVAFLPGIATFHWIQDNVVGMPTFVQYFATGTSLALGYFMYGFTMLFVMPLINLLMRTSLKPWRGPYFSAEAVKWYIHNGITYLVRFTFLEFVTPTPFNVLFYKMMGMKIGKGTQINSTHISDPCLITLGKNVTIGGSATITGHYGQGGFLVLAPVKIGDGCTIGLRATVLGGVTIGDGAKILPNSVVLPKTVVPAGETWGGVPAQKFTFHKAA